MLVVPPKPQLILPSGTADCYFQYESASVCRLVPWGGNQIMIAGVRYTIPAAGITLAPFSGWANYPLVMAGVQNAGGGALGFGVFDPATTPLVIDAYGMPTPQGYPQYTIVGAFTQYNTNNFVQNSTFGGVVSYFNRRARKVSNAWNVATTSTGMVELSSAARVGLVFFTGDSFRFKYSGTVYCDTSGVGQGLEIRYSQNYAAFLTASVISYFIEAYAYSTAQFGPMWDAGPAGTPAQIITSLFGYTSGGTATIYGDCSCNFEG